MARQGFADRRQLQRIAAAGPMMPGYRRTLERKRLLRLTSSSRGVPPTAKNGDSPSATRMPNIGCSLNLPNSYAQNAHADGAAASPFLIVNVVPIDTDLQNGRMEVTPGTHLRR